MIELIFSDSGAGSLRLVKKKWTGSTIAAIELMFDVEDISIFPDWTSRFKVLVEMYNDREIKSGKRAEREGKRIEALILNLQNAAANGEAVRIWWSDAPQETCGYYWAMSILKDAAAVNISSIKVPRLWPTSYGYMITNGTMELSHQELHSVLHLEKRIGIEERNALASHWKHLVSENAPLRVVLNGMPCSVPESFYDYVILQSIPSGNFTVAEAAGSAMGNGPGCVSDWWYAKRIRFFLERGDFEIVELKDDFYRTTLRKAKRNSY